MRFAPAILLRLRLATLWVEHALHLQGIEPAIVKADCFRFRVNSAIDARYVKNWLNSPQARLSFIEQSHGVGRLRINLSDFKTSRIPLAPPEEQRRIVAKLEALDANSKRARADLDRIPALVARAKQAILAKAFDGELTKDWRDEETNVGHLPSAFDALQNQREKYHGARRGVRLRDLPPLKRTLSDVQSWIGCCLADVCELRLGYAFKSGWFSKDGVRLLRGANIAPARIDWTDEKRIARYRASEYDDYALKPGDIVIAMDRPVISTGIKVARVTAEDDGALLVQRVASPVLGEHLTPDYAWLLFNSGLFRAQIARVSTGSDLPHISGNDILGMEIPLPSVREQLEIRPPGRLRLRQIERMAADAASASKLLDRLDQALLAKAFRGELVPQDPDDESAEVLLARIRTMHAAGPKPGRRRKIDRKQRVDSTARRNESGCRNKQYLMMNWMPVNFGAQCINGVSRHSAAPPAQN